MAAGAALLLLALLLGELLPAVPVDVVPLDELLQAAAPSRAIATSGARYLHPRRLPAVPLR